MNSSAVTGLLAGLPAVLAGALGGAPWWAVGVIVIVAYLAVPLTSLILEHSRQRKGTLVDQKFAATLDQIDDPEKRIQAINNYLHAKALANTPQPPPAPPPGALPPTTPDSSSQSPEPA
ncbi:hypothetical protein ACH4MU_31125 [Streptomyces albidoflavus]|uniref:hypothetical protein n=1 Tax=Streptomyces albidoflavus TaxID=1886 RepID=UPI00099C69EE|nr:hypothetical protein [Streptomyces albidoflavus]